MTYIDGYVIPVQKRRIAAYKKLAILGRKLWMKHGAQQYFECVADDLAVQPGCGLGFTKLAKLKRGETLLYSFIVYRNRAQRNAVNKKVMAAAVRRITLGPCTRRAMRKSTQLSHFSVPERARWGI